MTTEQRPNKPYKVGDIIAVQRGERAISCKVISQGEAETKNGTKLNFQDEHVLWILGKNNKWPNFVQF